MIVAGSCKITRLYSSCHFWQQLRISTRLASLGHQLSGCHAAEQRSDRRREPAPRQHHHEESSNDCTNKTGCSFVKPFPLTTTSAYWLIKSQESHAYQLAESVDRLREIIFERCVADSPGTRIIDQLPTNDGQEFTICFVPEPSASRDLVKLLNNPCITITSLSTEQEAAYLEVHIK